MTQNNRQQPGGPDSNQPNSANGNPVMECAQPVELFHDGPEAYAGVRLHDHVVTWAVASSKFEDWLRSSYYAQYSSPPKAADLRAAIEMYKAQAMHDGEEIPVGTRLIRHGGRIFLDLCNTEWQIIEIDASGWRLADNPPVRFRRGTGAMPLPLPELGGTVDDLRPLLHVSDEDFVLVVAWLLKSLVPDSPTPLLAIGGEQGSAKTTTCQFLRGLIDPNVAMLRAIPSSERDLIISARQNLVMAYDNLSQVAPRMSDALCRLITGGGFSSRRLFTDLDETIVNVMRPVIINGIDTLIERSDLLDRCIHIEMPRIGDNERQPIETLQQNFRRATPRILGALLTVVSGGLSRIGTVSIEDSPRMADFARFIVAAEPSLPWESGQFMQAYRCNISQTHEMALDGSPLASLIVDFVKEQGKLSCTATELLQRFSAFVGATTKNVDVPKAPNGLSNILRRLASNLASVGVSVSNHRTTNQRTITLEYVAVDDADNQPPATPR